MIGAVHKRSRFKNHRAQSSGDDAGEAMDSSRAFFVFSAELIGEVGAKVETRSTYRVLFSP
jgi:hypothetical protein